MFVLVLLCCIVLYDWKNRQADKQNKRGERKKKEGNKKMWLAFYFRIPEVRVQIPTRIPVNLNEIFRGFSSAIPGKCDSILN
jgi:hypothetical protein